MAGGTAFAINYNADLQELFVQDRGSGEFVALHHRGTVAAGEYGYWSMEQYWENVAGAPDLEGAPVHLPLRPGALHVPQVVGERKFRVGMIVTGSHDKDQAGHNQAWRRLARLLWSPEEPLVMRRTMAYPALADGQAQPALLTHECNAVLQDGLDPSYQHGKAFSRLALRFINLDGYWYAIQDDEATTTISGGSGSITVDGDAATRRMRITLSGGSGLQVLTNTTNGCMMTFNGSTEGVLETDVDVFSFTAVQDGKNVTGSVNHSGDVFWMRLDPGVNEFTLTGGGSATISARAAYL